jgi:hypothetical protein
MNYANGATVVVNHFGKNKVGTVTERISTKKGVKYIIASEDGRVIEDVRVDGNEVTSFIDSRLTKSFNKHIENGN